MCSALEELMADVIAEREKEAIERGLNRGMAQGIEQGMAQGITIGSDCWLASNVVVCAGVTIGEGCVIGAGSVVTRDIPPNSLAAGNPCRVIREITEADSVYLKKELF